MAMNTIAPRHDEISREFRELGLTFERATDCVLAYLHAFVLAVLAHIERTTGRIDYDDFEPVWPENETLQQLWRAPSTVAQMHEARADADLICRLRDIPALVAIAEDCTRRLLPLCRM
jgi:hypothetical protein